MAAERSVRVLLVEDDPDDVVLFRALLGERKSAWSHDIDHADSVEAARSMLGGVAYDICLCDYQLGPENGLDVLRHARDGGYENPFIMLTGHGDEAVAVEAMKVGAADYLVKHGLSAEHLENSIRHALLLHDEATRRRAAEVALRTSEARYRDLVNRLPVIVCELTGDGETLFVNDAVEAITGYAPDELIGRDWWEMLTDRERSEQILRVRAALQAGDIAEFEMDMKGKGGESLTIEWNSANRYSHDGELANVACIGADVTERVHLREELRMMAVRDELTGLTNRRGFLTLADQQLKLAHREKLPLLLVFIDMDGLKAINDELGHAVGDRALVDLGDVIRETFRESDVIGRLGGDEFVALVREGSPFRDDGVIERLRAHMTTFNERGDRAYLLSASIGVARYDPNEPVSVSQLLNRADTVMYEQKHKRQRRTKVVRAGAVKKDA
jgi:diguanylate cyclase (GGDEF)-like protein/PAS domain S-box-containing protein